MLGCMRKNIRRRKYVSYAKIGSQRVFPSSTYQLLDLLIPVVFLYIRAFRPQSGFTPINCLNESPFNEIRPVSRRTQGISSKIVTVEIQLGIFCKIVLSPLTGPWTLRD